MAARDGFALCARESNLNTVDLWTPSEICGANADYKQIPSNPSKGMTLIAIQRKKDAREGMYPSSGDTCEHGKSNDCNSRRPFSRWFYRELNDNTREDSVLDFLRDSVEYGWAVMIAVAVGDDRNSIRHCMIQAQANSARKNEYRGTKKPGR